MSLNIQQLELLQQEGKDTVDTNFKLAKLLANSKDYNKALDIAILFKDDLIKYNFIFLSIKEHLNLLTKQMALKTISDISNKQYDESNELKTVINILNRFNEKKFIYYDITSKYLKISELPRNFSMIDDFIGGSAIINESSIGSLIALNFKKIVCLLEEENEIKNLAINRESYPIIDRTWTPYKSSISDIDIMNSIIKSLEESVSRSEKVIVHCLGGIGRTNVVLGCYLMKKTKISPSEATSILNKQRNIFLTTNQINFMKTYYAIINNYITEKPSINLPKFIMLVGKQCSGKTFLSNKLIIKYGNNIVHINQDDLGKKECVQLFLDNCKNNKTIILDRCNKTKIERKEWLNLIFSKNILCIHFDLPIELCKNRMLSRENHPTLSGKGGIKILEETSKLIEVPEKSEGFEKIINIRNDDDLNELYKFFQF